MKCSKNMPLGFSFYCLVIKLSIFEVVEEQCTKRARKLLGPRYSFRMIDVFFCLNSQSNYSEVKYEST